MTPLKQDQQTRLRQQCGALVKRALVASLCAGILASCAGPGPGTDGESTLLMSDPDLSLPASWPYVEAPLLTRPEPRPDFDCNNNRIDDAFDIAGLIPRGPYAVGNRPDYISAGDFNGDGLSDLAVSNHDDASVTILWQRSYRRFDRSSTININTRPDWHSAPEPGCIDTGDVDSDGDIDIVVAPQNGPFYFLLLLRNAGDGDFSTEEVWLDDPVTSLPAKCVTLADIDADGDLDILTTSGIHSIPTAPAERVTLFRNTGDGSFPDREFNETDLENIGALTTADIDGDGHPEVLFTAGLGRGGNLGLIENGTPDGTAFADWVDSWRDLPGITRADALVAADILDDAGVNLAVLKVDGMLNVLPNSTGVLRVPIDLFDYAVGAGGLSMGVADINHDGNTDVFVPSPSTNSVAMLRNFRRRSLEPAVHLPVSDGPRGVFAGNLDTDSRAEIAVTHRGTNDVWVLHVRPEPVSEDCNNNDRPDSCDIRDNPDLDADDDGVPDGCEGMLPAHGGATPLP